MKKKRNTRGRKKNLPRELALEIEECCEKELVVQRNESTDRISQLPNDILESIISLLTLREASLTKTLSTPWRHLHIKPNIVSLDYPFPLKKQEMSRSRKNHREYIQVVEDEDELSRYISRVNETLDSYEGGRVIKKFKADFPYMERANVDKWLEFALSREIETIDIRILYRRIHNPSFHISPLSALNDGYFPGLKFLKELSISGASVNGSIMEQLLSNCIALEFLSIDSPKTKSLSIEVHGHRECKLKHLIISNFSHIACIIVHNVINLVSLRLYGQELYYVDLVDVPKVAAIRARCATDAIPTGTFPDISFWSLQQLSRLELCVGLDDYKTVGKKLVTPKMRDLLRQVKHLELNVLMDKKCSVHQLFGFFEACPYLEILEIKFLWSSKPDYEEANWLYKDRSNKMNRINRLKTMRLSGYFGSKFELNFVLRVMKNAVSSLENLIVEARDKNEAIQPNEIARAFQHLQSVAPPSVDLILL